MAKPRRRPGDHIDISAVVIAKDEQRHIADLAASLRGVVDEMVLLDTGSTDATVDLAKANGFRVFHREWTDHFAEARNAALAHARGEWVLSIDADERLVTEHRDDIRQVIEILRHNLKGDKADGFWISLDNFLTDDLDPEATERYEQLRLFRRSRFRFEGRIHERLFLTVDGRSPLYLRAPSTIRITHLGYTPAISNQKQKMVRNRALVETALAETKADGENAAAAAQLRFERARIEMSTSPLLGLELMLGVLRDLPADDDLHRHGTAMAARALIDTGRAEEALQLLAKTVPSEQYAPMLSMVKAVALARSGHDTEAVDLLAQMEQSHDRNSSDMDLQVRLPALKAELLATSGEPRESWRALLALMSRVNVDLAATARGIADRAWRFAVRAGRPDSYLAELSEVTANEQFAQVLTLLPEEHQRAAAGVRHVLLHGPLAEPDPRLSQFLPRLAGYSVAAALELGRRRLDSEPALTLGVAAEISRRADATPGDVDAAQLLQVRALLLLNHVDRAVALACKLPVGLARPIEDERLRNALSRMALEFADACVAG